MDNEQEIGHWDCVDHDRMKCRKKTLARVAEHWLFSVTYMRRGSEHVRIIILMGYY